MEYDATFILSRLIQLCRANCADFFLVIETNLVPMDQKHNNIVIEIKKTVLNAGRFIEPEY